MPSKPTSELIGVVHDAYPTVAADLIEPLITFFIAGREALGDSDKVLLLLVISARTKQDPAFQLYTTEELEAGALPLLPSLGVNVRSLSESTGVPKETVRRKLGEMVEAGVLARSGKDFRYTPEGYRAVHSAREAIENMAARHYQTVFNLVEKRLNAGC